MVRCKQTAWLLVFFHFLLNVPGATSVHAETLEELSRRVEALEQTVRELQEQLSACCRDQRVSGKFQPRDIWTCEVTGRRKTFYGNGKSRGLAERDAMEQCQQVSDICRLEECTRE